MEASASSSPEETQPAASDVLASSSDEQEAQPYRFITSSAVELRRLMEQWVDVSEVSNSESIPPVCMVIFPDLLERVWGWERLLPEVHSSVEWHDYKTYLVQYLQKNALKVARGKDALRDAVSRCIEAERRLIRTCNSFLSFEELCLTQAIKSRARDMVQSDDGEYPAAAATLLAIMTEAELMCEMEIHSYRTSAMSDLAHQIRQAAFNLILCGDSESEAVIAVMVGLVEESKLVLDALCEDSRSAFMICHITDKMRRGIAKVLTKLDQELASKTTGNAGTLTSAMKNKPTGSSTELNKQCERDGKNGNKKTSKSLHNVAEESGQALKNNETGTKAVAY